MRVFVFPQRPQFLLLHRISDAPVELPPVLPEFTKEAIIKAFSDDDLQVHVTETVPGRWTPVMARAMEASMPEGHTEAEISSLLLRRKKIIVESVELKKSVMAAKEAARERRQFMDRKQFTQKNVRLLEIQKEIVQIDSKIEKLRAEKRGTAAMTDRAEAERFMLVARDFLDKDLFLRILEAANKDDRS